MQNIKSLSSINHLWINCFLTNSYQHSYSSVSQSAGKWSVTVARLKVQTCDRQWHQVASSPSQLTGLKIFQAQIAVFSTFLNQVVNVFQPKKLPLAPFKVYKFLFFGCWFYPGQLNRPGEMLVDPENKLHIIPSREFHQMDLRWKWLPDVSRTRTK